MFTKARMLVAGGLLALAAIAGIGAYTSNTEASVGPHNTLEVHTVYVVPSDQVGVRYDDAAAAVIVDKYTQTNIQLLSREAGVAYDYTFDTIFTPLTFRELSTEPDGGWPGETGDPCGQGVWENTLWHQVVYPYLIDRGYGVPLTAQGTGYTDVVGRRDYRIFAVVKMGGGYAGGRTSISDSENAGEMILGDWGLFSDVNGYSDPCCPSDRDPYDPTAHCNLKGEPDFCHEKLHAMGVLDVHNPYIGTCFDSFDEQQRTTLLQNSAPWLYTIPTPTPTETNTPTPTPTVTLTPTPTATGVNPFCPPGWRRKGRC